MVYYMTRYHSYAVTHPIHPKHQPSEYDILPFRVVKVEAGSRETEWEVMGSFHPTELHKAIEYAVELEAKLG